ncbi:MAG TPA: hypothetical protein PK208_06070 [Fibrobacteria bacterium]|nr:hypothetical protein [Fibrobacteria bacterium]
MNSPFDATAADEIRRIHEICAEGENISIQTDSPRPTWWRFFKGGYFAISASIGITVCLVAYFLPSMSEVLLSVIRVLLLTLFGLSISHLLIAFFVDFWFEFKSVIVLADPFSKSDSVGLDKVLENASRLHVFSPERIEQVAVMMESRATRIQNHLGWIKGTAAMFAAVAVLVFPSGSVFSKFLVQQNLSELVHVLEFGIMFGGAAILGLLSILWRCSTRSANRALYLRRIRKEQDLFKER